jgi:signal transduction histidine kinase
VGDQTYKRSRNIDTLRMLLFDREAQGPRCIAGGVPDFLERVVAPADPLFGVGFADDLRSFAASTVGPTGSDADGPARLFDFTGGTALPAAERMGGVRSMERPSEPPRWTTAYEAAGGGKDDRAFDWAIAIFYDLDEGSVAPLVRTQVLILSALLLTVMLAACWIVARMISKPIRSLREMTAALAAGRWKPDPAASGDGAGAGPREIHELDRAFREMAAHVVTKQALQEKNKALEDTIDRLNNTQQELQVSNMLASLGVISGEYAHAVNNGLQLPLATLQQLESNLANVNLPENLREDIPASVESLKHTAGFVSQFRDFARSDNYSMASLDLNAVVESVAVNWRPQLRRRQIELETDLGRPPPVWGNDSLLMHVLLNLLLNSRDAVRERRKKNPADRGLVGKVRLATSAEGRSAVLSITDNGCGIPPETAPRIFQAMFTTKPKGEGSGLGLSSVLRAVRRHGGEIWFESKVNQGTTFFIRFPPADQAERMFGPGKKTSGSGLRPPILDVHRAAAGGRIEDSADADRAV